MKKRPHVQFCSETTVLSLFGFALTFLACIEAGAQSSFTNEGTNSEKDFRISFRGTYQYSSIRGYLQTPAGGKPGTTSKNRPTLKELGLDKASSANLSVRIGSGRHNFYGAAQFVHLYNDVVLDDELISRGLTYPAGSEISAGIQLDLYQLGYQYRFVFDEKRSCLEIEPTIEMVFLDFQYKLDAPAGLSADRGYIKGTVRTGAEVQFYATEKLTISGSVIGSVPISNTPNIWTLELTTRYQLWKQRDRGAAGVLGIAYERIEYEDRQTVPNHIKVEMGPMLIAGLEIGF